ncbi:ATP-dependent DNA helicase UvrD2 [Flexivirga sp. B27]
MTTTSWGADDVLAGLDPEQRQVASNPLGPMCVLAGAGTGKTRAITHRIAYGVHSGAYRPDRVLAVTFTARAAGEMRTRLRGLGLPTVQARTFHSAALRQLQYFWPQAIGGPIPQILKHKAPAVGEAGARLRLELDRVVIRDLAAEIEWAKVSMLTPETYRAAAAKAGRSPAELDLTAMARLWETYEEVKSARDVIDFEDVLLLMAGVLAERDDIAATVRGQYRHFVVDEYQDVNAAQQALLDQWVGDRPDLCVVGDPAQTIYSFTGATPRHLLDFAKRRPETRTVQLVRNYRSTPQVVDLANLVLQAGPRHAETVRLQAQRESGPQPVLTQLADDEAEAAYVAESVKKLLEQGVPASEIAVLYRINAQSEAVEQALAAAEIPYLVRGGERFFQRSEVKQALVLLRGAVRSDDGSVELGKLVRDIVTAAGWSPQRPAGGAVLERWQSLNALAELADDLGGEDFRLRELVVELDRRAAEQHAPTVEGVTLASLHAAKGLEWDAVLLIGCSDGLLPFSLAEGQQAIEEERRLTYVGLTRARKHLLLSWAAARNPGGRASRRPSRFLDAAAPVLGPGARSAPKARSGPAPKKPSKPKTCRTCGNTLDTAAERKIGRCSDCPATYDEAQFEALRAWRLEVATRTKVPAFVVFTDATLIAIAERRPSDIAGLAGVSGVGKHKRDTYGDAVLAVLDGADPVSAAAECVTAQETA